MGSQGRSVIMRMWWQNAKNNVEKYIKVHQKTLENIKIYCKYIETYYKYFKYIQVHPNILKYTINIFTCITIHSNIVKMHWRNNDIS